MTVVERALAAQRGAAAVAAGRPLHVRLRIRGNLLAARLRSPFVRPYELVVDTRRPHATLRPFHRPNRAGVFDGDRVAIEENGAVVRERDGARAHARGHLRWDELDLLYFLGYALWNYAMTPYCFTWPGFVVRELEPWQGLDRLEVTYPAGFPTHAPVQTFYIDGDGLVVRLDYVAEVFSDSALGAHLLEGHRDFGGFVFPTHRHVRLIGAGNQPRRWFPAAMEGWVDDVRFGD